MVLRLFWRFDTVERFPPLVDGGGFIILISVSIFFVISSISVAISLYIFILSSFE